MGIFDNLANLSPEQTQGLLAFASSALQAGGSGRPVSFGGALGGGIQAFQQSMEAQKRLKLEQQQAAQVAQLTGLKIKDAESDLANQQALRERAEGLRKFYMKQAPGGSAQSAGGMPAANMGGEVFAGAASSYGLPTDNEGLNKIVGLVNQGMTPTQAAASLAGKSAPTVENSQMMQGAMQAPQGQTAPTKKASLYEQRLAQAEALRNAGYGPEADAAEAAALKFQPKVKEWKEVRVGNQVLYAPYFEGGEAGQPVPLELARKLEARNTGGSTDMVDPYIGNVVSSVRNTQTPDGVANNAIARANLGLSRERLNFDKQQPRGQIIQTDQGPMLADPRAGTARPVIGPDGQTLGPKARAVPTQIQKAYVENGSALRKVQDALDSVKQYPDALGVRNYLGDNIRQRTDPNGVNVRALVADIGSQKIHDRSGAAVTASETPRLKPFIPAATDDPATVEKKLRMFQAEYQAMQSEMEEMYSPEMGYRPLGKSSGEKVAPADSKPASSVMAAKPTANAGNKGRVLVENETGKKFQSNGLQWVEVK